MRVRIVVFTLLCCWFNSIAVLYAAESSEKYKIIFSTFDISSAGQYTYLRDGVQNMLAGRLSAKDRVDVLDHSLNAKELQLLKTKELKESSVAEELKADYLVTGALFSLTSGLNIQIVMYPLVTDKESYSFSILAESIEAVIPEVEKLAQDIAEEVFGYTAAVVQDVGGKGEIHGDSGFATVHPEVAYKKGLYTGTVIGTEGGMVKTNAVGVKRRTEIAGEMRAMAVGDINGNGEEEVLVLTGENLEIYRLAGRKIEQIAKTPLPSDILVHAVNIADIDGDNIQEIYLSGTQDLYVASMIMTWDGEHGFKTIGQYVPWYIRPVFVPGRGLILAGQKRGIDKVDLVRPGIYQLNINAEKKIIQGEQLPLPREVNLFDFVYADINGDETFEIAVIDQKEKLKIYNQANELMWVSTKNFGGNKIYIGPSYGTAVDERSKKNFTVNDDWERDLVFVPGRIIVADLNLDGKQEIIVSEHERSSFGFFKRLRPYAGGSVVGLTWNGSGLSELWRTGRFSGYVAGYAFDLLEATTDSALDGKKATGGKKSVARLHVGNNPTSGSLAELLPGITKSELTVYELEFERIKPE